MITKKQNRRAALKETWLLANYKRETLLMQLNPRFVRMGFLILFSLVSLVGCGEHEDESYADCILSNSEKFASDAGTSAIKAACREKFPEPQSVVEDESSQPEPEKPAWRILSPDELPKVKVTENLISSYVPGMANDVAHMASAQGAKLDWRISVQVESDHDFFIRAVQLELFTGGDWKLRSNCFLDLIALRTEARENICEGLTAYNEIIEVDIPPQGLREVEIPVARECCVVRIIGAATDNTELE